VQRSRNQIVLIVVSKLFVDPATRRRTRVKGPIGVWHIGVPVFAKRYQLRRDLLIIHRFESSLTSPDADTPTPDLLP
jgi:hypothetical protein